MSIVGRTYLENGQRVRVMARWRSAKESRARIVDAVEAGWIMQEVPTWPDGDGLRAKRREGPRNVLIRRRDGSLVVRPFRGLRKSTDSSEPAGRGLGASDGSQSHSPSASRTSEGSEE